MASGDHEFDFSHIMSIAMIQVPDIVRRDISVITKYFKKKSVDTAGCSTDQIWYAFERCGYDPRAIENYIKQGGNVEPLPFHIKDDEWAKISPCRQDAIRVMFSNPSAFFYRNRPPGQEPLFGNWSEEEEFAFHDRMLFFQHFGISEKHWGLFAANQKRFGYSCSSWAKNMYKPEKYKNRPKPTFPDIPKEEIVDYLKKEAVQIIIDSIKSAGERNAAILSGEPSKPGKSARSKNKKPEESTSSHEKIDSYDGILTRNKEKALAGETAEKSTSNKGKRQAHEHADKKVVHETKVISLKAKDEKINLALGAKDQITGLPMRKPTVNRDGYVLDRETWKLIREGRIVCPFDITAYSKSDLVEVTAQNFNELKPFLLNILY